MAQLLDLRRTTYRWKWGDDHEPGMRYDPYHVRLIGKYGTVHVAGDDMLGCWVWSMRQARKLESAGMRVVARGDEEMIVRFPASELDRVAGIVKLYRRPRRNG